MPTTTTTSTTTTTTSTTTTTTKTSTTTTTTTTPTTTTTTTPTTTTTTPTTTTTTVPPGDDAASVRVTGAFNYTNQGSGPGSIVVRRDANGVVSANGSIDVPGAKGGTATISVNVARAWILPLWTGQVSVRDAGAGIALSAPSFSPVSRGDTPDSARGTVSWFSIGQFPNLFRPYTLNWSVNDGG